MTVRADITGRYSNRMYAYEPVDMKICKYRVSQPDLMTMHTLFNF